jgi:calcium channel MID1
MQLPKLTPLQSRFAASLMASLTLLILYLTLNKPSFAYAAEIESRIPPDHNHPILDTHFDEARDDLEDQYAQVKRAADGVSALANNNAQNMNIDIGISQYWTFPKDSIDGPPGVVGPGLPGSQPVRRGEAGQEVSGDIERRQSDRTVWISLNTCLQPSNNASDSDGNAAIPPQLQMYISRSDSNQKPGPDIDDPDQVTITVDGGYALYTGAGDSSIYVGIAAPNGTGLSGIWNYEIAASIDAPYHFANTTWANLYFVDGDNHAALLITNDTTQAEANSTIYQDWMSIRPPYGMFAIPHTSQSIYSVRNSYCGLKNSPVILTNLQSAVNQNTASMTSRGLGGKPKEQFYVTNLTSSSSYWGILAIEGNSTASGPGVVGGGGTVFAAMNFTTKALSNCALMYNLTFCSEVAYAVPSNPDLFPPLTGGYPQLAALYDSYAARMYQYFNYSLQQIPCNTTSTAQYSLARTCDDCARAYKQWLCAVTIPRCEDLNNTSNYLKLRNLGQNFVNGTSVSTLPEFGVDGSQHALLSTVATNSSRNPIIDTDVRPGPYKEVLPCEDLCYDLVQSCPAALGFTCPLKNRGLEDSYGVRSNDSGIISCSYLGAAYYLSGGEKTLRSFGALDKALIAISVLVTAMLV